MACGTSYHAGLVGKYALERWARLPVEIDVASEFRYRDPVIGPDTLCVAISQSGETADTLAAMRLARQAGAHVLAVTNIVGLAGDPGGRRRALHPGGPRDRGRGHQDLRGPGAGRCCCWACTSARCAAT